MSSDRKPAWVLGVTAVAALAVTYAVVSQPSEFYIARSRTLKKGITKKQVFAKTADLHENSKWNPWQLVDPTQTLVVEGTPCTVGHSCAWKGKETGQGKMTIVEIQEPNYVVLRLDFVKPFPSTATSKILVEELEKDVVTVTWSLTGRNESLFNKVLSLVFNVDRMVGSEYEKGLMNLETLLL